MDVKERIYEFCKETKIPIRQFEIQANLSNGYVSSMRKGLGRGKLENVLKAFPDISREWLLYGEGTMFRTPHPHYVFDAENKEQTQKIPIYDLVATGGIVSVFQNNDITPEDYISLPGLPPVDGAVYIRGESMAPLIKSGDIIIYKKVALSEDNIMWGQIYLLSYTYDQDSYTSVKYLRRSDRLGYVRLVSENPNFDPQDIPAASITAIALVKASITFHTIE